MVPLGITDGLYLGLMMHRDCETVAFSKFAKGCAPLTRVHFVVRIGLPAPFVLFYCPVSENKFAKSLKSHHLNTRSKAEITQIAKKKGVLALGN